MTDDGGRDYQGNRFVIGLSALIGVVAILLVVMWIRARRRLARVRAMSAPTSLPSWPPRDW